MPFLGPSNKDRSVFNALLSCQKFLPFFWSLIFGIFFGPFLVFLRTFLCAQCNVHSVPAIPVCACGQKRKSSLTSFSGNSRASVEISPTHTHMYPRTYTHGEAPLRAYLPLHRNSCSSNNINWNIAEHKVEFRPDCIREVFKASQTNIHALDGIRTHDLSRRAAAELRLRPRGYWDRQG